MGQEVTNCEGWIEIIPFTLATLKALCIYIIYKLCVLPCS